MFIKRLIRQLKLAVWQYKRSLVIAAMFCVAVLVSLLLVVPGGLSVLALAQWSVEIWGAVVVGVVVCVGVVVWVD